MLKSLRGEQFSPFRYTYNNLDTNQRQPGWSFGGADGPTLWHKLDIRKFYSPILSNAKLSEVETDSDIAQAYPGLGELAEHFQQIEAPLDYRWTKDSGYHAYTRYLIPVLSSTDVEYYKYKGLLDESFKIPSDAQVIQHLIDALNVYLNKTTKPIVYQYPPNSAYYYENKWDFPTVEKIDFYKVYEEFLSHYLFADTTRYVIDLKKDARRDNAIDSLYFIYDVIRRIYRSYVEAVISQLKCTKAIVQQVTTRRFGMADIKRVLNNARQKCIDPIFGKLNSTTIGTTYFVSTGTLRFLYDTYFLRKESRQRYTLPLTPVQFPICKHNEPSPINIHTKKGRKSTLTSYKFGDAAYRLYKFFISFPTDGSTLLGMVDAERLDDSSVWLTGGAVKGQNLVFQTMLIRFGRDWESQGSEHLLDSKGGQMELQMIFTIAGSADPIKYWHVLARVQNRLFQFREKLVIILSVLVDALETEEAVIQKIEEEGTLQDPYLFEPFTQAAYHFRKERESNSDQDEPRGYVSVDPVFRFIDFIPKTKSKFYTYRGSLSWPPCFGYVIWSVYQQRLYISKRQFDEFIKIPAFGVVDHNRASENFRREDQIHVEEENDPNLDYTTRQNLIAKRTVNRFILEGTHNYDPEGKDSLVDEAVYYMDSDRAANLKESGLVLRLRLLLSSPQSMELLGINIIIMCS
ncbi:Nacrein-like protein, partial [Orchesella cincta]